MSTKERLLTSPQSPSCADCDVAFSQGRYNRDYLAGLEFSAAVGSGLLCGFHGFADGDGIKGLAPVFMRKVVPAIHSHDAMYAFAQHKDYGLACRPYDAKL